MLNLIYHIIYEILSIFLFKSKIYFKILNKFLLLYNNLILVGYKNI